MRHIRVKPPQIHSALLRAFGAYAHWFARRNFHAIRVAEAPRIPPDKPLMVVLNHPSWWDPLMALLLAQRCFSERLHYAPIDSAALRRYRFFGKLGFFGVDQGSAAGAAEFLRMGQAILSQPRAVLWVTAQGSFADPRVRPVQLRPGAGHLLARVKDVAVLPVALEYPFWEERYPEALARFGDVIVGGPELRPDDWTARLSSELGRTQDLLAADAVARNASAFALLSRGRAGIGGMYDIWRGFRASLRGERFRRAHGSEPL